MTKTQAKRLVTDYLNGGFSVTYSEDRNGCFVFVGSRNTVPSKMIAAINKQTAKIGLSLFSVDEAIEKAGR